ncbi:Hypothetical predicted protein, partial [Mytilus galloprovincialis]
YYTEAMALLSTWLMRSCQRLSVLPLRYINTGHAGVVASQNSFEVARPSLTAATKIFDIQRGTIQNFQQNKYPEISLIQTLPLTTDTLVYQCPSKTKPHKEILDIRNTVGMYECPNAARADIDFILPTMQFFNDLNIDRECPGIQKPEMLARKKVRKLYRLMRIRERMHNRHRLKRYRKKLKFLFIKLKRDKLAKKEAKLQSEIKGMYDAVESYDPLARIREEIALARKGGFRIDLFGNGKNDK